MGKRLKMIVLTKGHPSHSEHYVSHNSKSAFETAHKLPYETEANALMSEEFEEYVKKHGYHFTEALAEHVSKMMENANGEEHTWTAQQVKKAMENLGLIPLGETVTHATLGDVTYLANMYYADLYPDPFKDEVSCLKAAHKVAKDKDGYKGMIFCRWTADAIGKGISIDWKKFV